MYESCALAYPFTSLYGCVCGLPPLQWSSILLMWADVRNRGSGNGDGDATAWWSWTGMGSLWSPQLKKLLSRFTFLYKNQCCCVSCYFRVRQCCASFFCYGYVGVQCTPYPVFPHSL